MSDKAKRRSFVLGQSQARAKASRPTILQDGTIIPFLERASLQSDPNFSPRQNNQPQTSSSVNIYDADGRLICWQH